MKWAAQIFVAAFLALSAVSPSWGQSYPSKPIRLVVAFPPGGFADITGRIVAQRLGERLGQAVLVDNRPGGGSVIATEAVARAPADGYTLLWGASGSFTVNPVLLKIPYDPIKSFEPIGIVCKTSLVLLANPAVPANNLKELLALVAAHPQKYSYGSFGSGTVSNFLGEMFNATMGVKLLHVPYKGSSPSINALVAGEIPLSFDTVASAAAQLRAGTIKAIAVTAKERSSLFPEVPTIAEAGYPDFDVSGWVALAAPAGAPEPIVKRLRQEVTEIVALPEVREKFRSIGAEPARPDREEFVRIVQRDIERYSRIARDAHIAGD